jgi:hypothetical protein
MAVAREVEAALNPVLTPAGFLEGARGVDERNERGGVLFCIGHDEFSDRYPWAPQADAQKRGTGGCIDLMIETNTDTIEFIDLEAIPLEETLRRAGNAEEANRTAELIGRPVADALPILAGILQRVFDVSDVRP